MKDSRLSLVVLVTIHLLPLTIRAEAIVLVDGSGVTHGRAWGPEQALGPPDTPGAGDIQTAWASKTQDGQDEWLELEFEHEVLPEAVIVHETYNPGSLYRLTIYTKSGMEADVWSGRDPTPVTAARGISQIKIDPGFKTQRVRLYFDSKKVPGWNEIDAVGIKDATGTTHWAVAAQASSTYADGPTTGTLPRSVRDKLNEARRAASPLEDQKAVKQPRKENR